ncbi:uncharacterized protein METZ01_LOCUS407482 [marine metagenome]|uniref:Uncharacterized protein n=1 Tax=marine metagenome TaxID=408172 RepID=A0A382W923_9ZZZZ
MFHHRLNLCLDSNRFFQQRFRIEFNRWEQLVQFLNHTSRCSRIGNAPCRFGHDAHHVQFSTATFTQQNSTHTRNHSRF